MNGPRTMEEVRLITIGETQVGKTQINRRYFENSFDEDGVTTIAGDHLSKTIVLDGQPYKLSAWDTAGQERYRSITRSFYRNAEGVILVYDVNSQDSFEALGIWFADIDKYAPPKVPVVLVGNKIDLFHTVELDDAESLVAKMGITHFHTSAKNGDGIAAMFDAIIRLALRFKKSSRTVVRTQTTPELKDDGKHKKGHSCCR